MQKKCKNCGKQFSRHKKYSNKQWKLQKLCGRKCMGITFRGRSLTAETKAKLSQALRGNLSEAELKLRKRVRGIFYRTFQKGHIKVGKCQFRKINECKGKMEAHHTDYTRPLYVHWLCRGHHLKLHRKVIWQHLLINPSEE